MKVFEPDKGANIWGAAQSVVFLAACDGKAVRLLFNDINIEVGPRSDPQDIVTIYGLKCDLRRALK